MTNPDTYPESTDRQPRHLHPATQPPSGNETDAASQPERTHSNDGQLAGEEGHDHQSFPTIPEGAIDAWAALTEREYVPGSIPDDFHDSYLGTWPDRQTYIHDVLTGTLGVTLERIEDHYGLPPNYLTWNDTAIWHDLTQRFHILADDDGVHVFDRWDEPHREPTETPSDQP
jgi:hypothetical protein